LSLPHIPQFFLYFQNRTCTETPSKLKFMKLSFQRARTRMNGFRTRELCLFYSDDESVQTTQRSIFLS
jgi:hypothetical protein